jgi:hypothetical protein
MTKSGSAPGCGSPSARRFVAVRSLVEIAPVFSCGPSLPAGWFVRVYPPWLSRHYVPSLPKKTAALCPAFCSQSPRPWVVERSSFFSACFLRCSTSGAALRSEFRNVFALSTMPSTLSNGKTGKRCLPSSTTRSLYRDNRTAFCYAARSTPLGTVWSPGPLRLRTRLCCA